MSRENVELVRRIYGAYARGDYGEMFERFHPEIEWFGLGTVSESGSTRGHTRARRSLSTWIGTWDDYRFELRELIDCGDEVFAAGWQRGRGRGSGVEVAEEIFSVWTIRGGLVVRQRVFRDRARAREAAGLSG